MQIIKNGEIHWYKGTHSETPAAHGLSMNKYSDQLLSQSHQVCPGCAFSPQDKSTGAEQIPARQFWML